MSSSDTVRVIIGVGVVAIAGAATLYAVRAKPALPAPDSDPSPSVMISAAEQGVDLTNGSPEQDRDRLVGLFEQGETTPIAESAFRGGMYFRGDTDEVFSGYLSVSYDDGTPRLICCVVDGRLQGPSVELYPSGGIKQAMTHKDGRLVGQIIAYYTDGSLKIRAMARQPSDSGGDEVTELLVGEHDDGVYRRKTLGSGRVQMILEDGTTTGANDEIPLHKSAGWMIFYDSVLQGQRPYTTDSRNMDEPSP